MPEKAFSVCIKDSVFIDPCCGSGGMFVQSMKFVDRHNGNRQKISIIGQESQAETWRLCKMNLAIRGIAHNLGEKNAYRRQFSILQVGTGDSPLTIPFYEKCGFVRSHTVPNFFTDHYDHPIYECGVHLVDMVYLQRPL